MKLYRRRSRLERWYQRLCAWLASFNFEYLVNICFFSVFFIWLIWLAVFRGVMP